MVTLCTTVLHAPITIKSSHALGVLYFLRMWIMCCDRGWLGSLWHLCSSLWINFLLRPASLSASGSSGVCSLTSVSPSDGVVFFSPLWPNEYGWCQRAEKHWIKIPLSLCLQEPSCTALFVFGARCSCAEPSIIGRSRPALHRNKLFSLASEGSFSNW